MDPNFHLSFEGKNARVVLLNPKPKDAVTRRVSPRRQEVSAVKVELGLRALPATPESVEALRRGDPELDLGRVGRIVEGSTRAHFDPETGAVARDFQWVAVHTSPTGQELERKPWARRQPNVCHDVHPVKVGKLVPRAKFFGAYVVEKAVQLVHDDGVTYDYLYGLARQLEQKDAVALLGAGPKGAGPLIFRDNGKPYRCALTGRTEGERYLLRVLLLGQELKVPEGRQASGEGEGAA